MLELIRSYGFLLFCFLAKMTKRRALSLAHLQQTVEMEGKEEGGTYEALQQEVVWERRRG
jgi:hypothetical protein